MAEKDQISIGGMRESAANIHFSVGEGGDNGPADVMLIQTMFQYMSHLKGKVMKNVGLSLDEVPEITGRCDQKTKQAIMKFQQKNANRVLRIDGLIEPAKYEGRSIVPGRRYMTMTWLHFRCSEIALFNSDPNYIDALVRMVPQLRPWLA